MSDEERNDFHGTWFHFSMDWLITFGRRGFSRLLLLHSPQDTRGKTPPEANGTAAVRCPECRAGRMITISTAPFGVESTFFSSLRASMEPHSFTLLGMISSTGVYAS